MDSLGSYYNSRIGFDSKNIPIIGKPNYEGVHTVNTIKIEIQEGTAYVKRNELAYAHGKFTRIPYVNWKNSIGAFSGTGTICLDGSLKYYTAINVADSGIFIRKDLFSCAIGNFVINKGVEKRALELEDRKSQNVINTTASKINTAKYLLGSDKHVKKANTENSGNLLLDADLHRSLLSNFIYIKGSGCIVFKTKFDSTFLKKLMVRDSTIYYVNRDNLVLFQDTFTLEHYLNDNTISFKLHGNGVIFIDNILNT